MPLEQAALFARDARTWGPDVPVDCDALLRVERSLRQNMQTSAHNMLFEHSIYQVAFKEHQVVLKMCRERKLTLLNHSFYHNSVRIIQFRGRNSAKLNPQTERAPNADE